MMMYMHMFFVIFVYVLHHIHTYTLQMVIDCAVSSCVYLPHLEQHTLSSLNLVLSLAVWMQSLSPFGVAAFIALEIGD